MSQRTLVGAGLAACVLGLLVYVLFLSQPTVRQAIWLSPPLRPVVMQGFQNTAESDVPAKYFFFLMRRHEYAGARQLLTPDAQKSLSVAVLAAQWAAFEKAHGRVTTWTLTGEKSNLLPAYVVKQYAVHGSKGTSGSVTLQMAPSKDFWQITRLRTSN